MDLGWIRLEFDLGMGLQKKEGKHMRTQRKRLAAVLLSATLTLSNLAGILP